MRGIKDCPGTSFCERSQQDSLKVGLVGTSKGWRVLVGGNGGANPRLADTLALRVETHEAVRIVEKLIQYYKTHAQPKDRMGKTIERLGLSHPEEALNLGGAA